jgi:acyl-CoA reductase-like NAD-dependent aldehyde dehydrogenase
LLIRANRDAALLSQKIRGPLLIVHAISSLDDGIDYANQSTESTLAASYIFAALPEANYLANFVDAHVSFINHIPTELLGKKFPFPAFSPLASSPRRSSCRKKTC